MDESDKKRRRMNTEGEFVNEDHDKAKQKTDGAQIVAIDDLANFSLNEKLNTSDIADFSTEEFMVVKTKLTFVDKSEYIKSFFECSPEVQITAPRRFGKSTFLNMLMIFLKIIVDKDANPITNPESSDNYKIFMNLKLGQYHHDFVKKHFGQYPVIFLSLKNVEGKDETDVLDSLKMAICEAFEQHLYLLETALDGSRRFKNKKIQNIERFLKYCDEEKLKELSVTNVKFALKFLSKILHTHFNKKVVILIDETDAPIMKAITNNQSDNTIEFIIDLLRGMLSTSLKSNQYLGRSLVSSSIRLSGVYSWDINNQYHALFLQNKHFSKTYGFTREEIDSLLEKDAFQVARDFHNIKKWYNGYQILRKDETTIYNSWSVINYLTKSVEEEEKMFGSYWAKSGWLDNLGKLFVDHKIQEAIGKLVNGESISIKVAAPKIDNILELKKIIFYPRNMLNEPQMDFFLQLLWDDGLLNAVDMDGDYVELKIPNLEVKTEIERTCYTQLLFEEKYKLKPENIERYIQAVKKLLQITSNEEESGIEEYEEETTKEYEEAMSDLASAISLLFSDDAVIPVNEAELHHILYYLPFSDKYIKIGSHRAVVSQVSEEFRESANLKKLPRRKAKGSHQDKIQEKRGRKKECDMCVTLGTSAVLFEFKFLKGEEAENSKAALQQIIKKKYTLFDQEEYKQIKTKVYVGLCVRSNLDVSMHYLVNDTDLDQAKNVAYTNK